MSKIVVVDDEKDMLSMVEKILTTQRDYEVLKASTCLEAMVLIDVHNVNVILTDMKMPDMTGLEFLDRIKERWPDKTIIIMTGFASIENAVEAMKRGAYDYITKPFQYDDLLLAVDKASERALLLDEKQYLQSELHKYFGVMGLIGNGREMIGIYNTIKNIASTSVPVLLTGESGTGKEVAARAIHFQSKRKERHFVAINCAALPETILESELFGHVKGTFTGAIRDKKGLIEESDGGTLFLDEVGDLSPQIQVKLLRVLQDGEFRSLGALKVKRVDLRVISATNRNLENAVLNGTFREDLYYRLKVVTINMPPLRERKEDIPLLASYFLKKYATKYEKDIQAMTDPAMQLLMNRQWKGNVRELENAIAKAVAVSTDSTIRERDLLPNEAVTTNEDFKTARKRVLIDFYKTYLTSALIRNKGNISKAAEECGMLRQSFQQLMKRCHIDQN